MVSLRLYSTVVGINSMELFRQECLNKTPTVFRRLMHTFLGSLFPRLECLSIVDFDLMRFLAFRILLL